MNLNNTFFSYLVYLLFLFSCILAFLCPVRIWMFLGRTLGRLGHYILPKYRQIAHANIRHTIGEKWTEEEIANLVKKNFQQMGMLLFDCFRCPAFKYVSFKRQMKHIRFEGLEHFEEAKKSGKGIILLGAHFGIMEYANLAYAYSMKRNLNFILREFDNKHLTELMKKHNNPYNINLLYKKKGLRTAVKNVLKGQDLMIFPDQRATKKESIKATLLGKPTSTLNLIPHLAKKLGSPVLPMFIVRHDDHITHTIHFLEPFHATEDTSLEELAQKQNDAIETAIRLKPELWLWLHKRWKSDAKHIYS